MNTKPGQSSLDGFLKAGASTSKTKASAMKAKPPPKKAASRFITSDDDDDAFPGDDPAPRDAPKRTSRAPTKAYVEVGSDDDDGDNSFQL